MTRSTNLGSRSKRSLRLRPLLPPMQWRLRLAPLALALGVAGCTPQGAGVGPRRPASGGAPTLKTDAIHLLSPGDLQGHNVDGNQVGPWAKQLERTLARLLEGDTGNREVVVVVVLHPDRRPSVQIGARPGLAPRVHASVAGAVGALEDLRTRFIDFPFLMVMKMNQGNSDKKLELQPPLSKPSAVAQQRFGRLAPAQQVTEIQRWAAAHLPLLGKILASVEARFAGVRGFGEALKAIPRGTLPDVGRLTDHNPHYWRALVEMAPGDKSVALCRILLYAVRGELDQARRLSGLYGSFAEANSTSQYLIDELFWRLQLQRNQELAQIQRGTALHDAKRYEEAIPLFLQVLGANPKSALGLWELYFSRQMLAAQKAGRTTPLFEDWATARQAIYAADPLSDIAAVSQTGVEAYQAFRRFELRELTSGKVRGLKALLTLADISLDLGVYSMSAELYWLLLAHVKESAHEGQDVLGRFLYSLEKLGNPSLKQAFKGDHEARFRVIASELASRMKSHPAFKAICRSGLDPKSDAACPPGKQGHDLYIELKSPPRR